MMTILVMVILLGSAAACQLHWPPFALLAHAKPPLVMAVVLYYALNRDTNRVLVAALLGGLLLDALGHVPLGTSVVLLAVIGMGAGRFRKLVLSDSVVTAGFFGGLGGFLLTVLTYLVLARGGHVSWPWGRLLAKAAWSAVFGLISTPLVFVVGHRCDQWLGNIEVREVIDGIEQPLGR